VEEAVVGGDDQVARADALAQHHAARRRAQLVGGSVEDERRHRDGAHRRGKTLDGVGDLRRGPRRDLAVVHERI
jgi:hypothetical protein